MQLDPIAGSSRDRIDAQMQSSYCLLSNRDSKQTDRAVHVRCQKTFVYLRIISSCLWTGMELHFRAADLVSGADAQF